MNKKFQGGIFFVYVFYGNWSEKWHAHKIEHPFSNTRTIRLQFSFQVGFIINKLLIPWNIVLLIHNFSKKNTFKVFLLKNIYDIIGRLKILIYCLPSDKTCARRVACRRVDPSQPVGQYSQLKRFIIYRLLIPWNIVFIDSQFQ